MRFTWALVFASLCTATSLAAQGLVSTTPSRHSQQVPRSSIVGATFSTTMQGAGYANLPVFSSRSGRRTGVYSGAGTAGLGFDPAADFSAGELVEVTYSAGLLDTGGAPLTNPQVLTFRAATAPAGAAFGNHVQTLAGGGRVVRVCFGDVDGDGDLDAVASAESGRLAVFTNTSGVFAGTPANYGPSNSFSTALVLGDLDGDGDLDALISISTSQFLVYSNQAGTFVEGTPFGTSTGWRPALADFDADGDLDFVASTSTSELRLYRNNGVGVFAASTLLSLGTSEYRALASGDVDNDGDIDLLVGTNNAGVVFFNDGTGAFSTTGAFGGSLTDLRSLALFDADGDGDLDLAAGTTTDGYLLTGTGAGTFSLAGSIYSLGALGDLQAGDLDGDGDLDLLVVQQGSFDPRNLVLANVGGTFGTPRVIDSVGFNTWSAELADLDGDGDLDIGSADDTAGIHIYPNNWPSAPLAVSPSPNAGNAPLGTTISAVFSQAMAGPNAGTFVVRGQGGGHRARGPYSGLYSGAGTATLAFDPGQDLRPNEEVEVVLTRGLTTQAGVPVPEAYVWRFRASAGTGPGVFNAHSAATASPTGTIYVATPADVDGDGDTDVVCGQSNGVHFLINDGSGGFAWQSVLTGTGSVTSLAAEDLDLDGDMDLAVRVSTPSAQLRVYLNLAGTFLLNDTITTTQAVQCGDLDGDGDPDLLLGGSMYRNNGAGGFLWTGSQHTFHTTPGGGQCALADIDRDGDLDVVMNFNSAASGISYVYLNDAMGYFPLRSEYASLGGGAPRCADLDNDGWLDLIAGASSGGGYAVSLNQRGFGNKYFGTPTVLAGSSGRLCIGDMDGDADLDIVTLGNGASAMFRNNGYGSFALDHTFGIISGSGHDLAPLDADNDGDLDLFMARSAGARIHFNAHGTAPAIVGFNPPAGSVSSAVGSSVDIQFNRDIPQTYSRTGLTAYSSQHGSQASFQSHIGPARITVTNLGALAGEEQQITVLDSVEDEEGTPLGRSYVYTRRIGASGPGGISFSSSTALGGATDAGTCALMFDYDNDGDRDVLIGRFGGPNTLYRNNGSGSFTAQLTVGTATDNTQALATGDFDQDGYLDVVVCNQGQSYVYRGAATNPFTSAATLGDPGDDIRAVAVGVFRSNGVQDLLVARYNGQDALFAWGSSACAPLAALGGAASSSLAVAAADIDRDGYLDAVFGYDGDAKRVFLNGPAGFAAGVALGTPGVTRGIAAGDLTGDYYPDLVCANDGPDEVFLNNGAGAYLAPTTFGGSQDSRAVLLCELDGDGDLDVVVARDSGQSMAYRNNAGVLASPANLGPALGHGAGMACADTNNDNQLEILFAQNGGQSGLYFNAFIWDTDATVSNGPLVEPTSFSSLVLAGSFQDVLDFTLSDGATSDGLPLVVTTVAITVTQGYTAPSVGQFKLTGPGVPGVLATQGSTVEFQNLNIVVPDGGTATFVISLQLATASAARENTPWQLALSAASFAVPGASTHFSATAGTADNGAGLVFSVVATELRCTLQPALNQYRAVPFDASATYTDAFGIRDYDITDTVTLTRTDLGTVSSTATATAVQGVASYSAATLNAIVLGAPAPASLKLRFTDDATGVSAGLCESNVFNLLDPNTWTGAVSTDWVNAANWAGGVVPLQPTTVYVPAGAAHAPAISASMAVGSIYVEAGATLSLPVAGTNLTVLEALYIDGNLGAADGTTITLNTAQLLGYGYATISDLSCSSGFLRGTVNVRGNITGGAGGGTFTLVLDGTAAQSVSGVVSGKIRVSNTSATVTFANTHTRTATQTLTIDTGALASFPGLTLMGSSSLFNSGTLELSGTFAPGTGAVGMINAKSGSALTLTGWVSANSGTLNIPSGASVTADGNCDFSSTSVVQAGNLTFRLAVSGTATRTIVLPSNALGALYVWSSGAANVLNIQGNLSCATFTMQAGSGTVNVSGSMSVAGNLTINSGTGASLNVGQTLSLATGSNLNLNLGTTLLRATRLYLGGSGTVTLTGQAHFASTGTGSSCALEVAAGSTLALGEGTRLQLGDTGSGLARIHGTLRAALTDKTPAVLAAANGAAEARLEVEATATLDLTGVNFERFGPASDAYGIVLANGCTVTAFSRINVSGAASSIAALRLATANRPTLFDRFTISGTAAANIDATGLSGTHLLVRSPAGPAGNLFGAAHEIDPAGVVDWDDRPYLTGFSPASNTYSAPPASDLTATFSEAMQAPMPAQMAAYGRHGGRLGGVVSGAGPTITMNPAANLHPGERVQVVLGQSLVDLSGSALQAPVVLEFSAASGVCSGVSTASALVGQNNLFPTGLSLADFDHDGDLDLLALNQHAITTNNSALFLNDGIGNFVLAWLVPTGQLKTGLAADVNGDGELDIVAVPYLASDSVRVMLNAGGGVFSTYTDYPGIHAERLIPADLDGDGDLDLLCHRVGSPATQSILWNDGTGGFGATPLTLGSADAALAGSCVADLDGDYDLDVVCGNRMFRNNGNGTFANSVLVFGSGAGATAAGDVDGDGDADLVASVSLADTVYLNDGTGSFTAGQQVGGSDQNTWIELVDLDGDGDLDLVTGGTSPGIYGFYRRLLNTGGVFGAPILDYAGSIGRSFCHAIGDVDGDLDVDVLLGAELSSVIVLYNDGRVPQAPALLSVSPTACSDSVPLNSVFSATFDVPLAPAQPGALVVRSALRGKLPGTVSVVGASVTFVPSAPLLPGESIELSVPAGLQPLAGSAATNSWAWQLRAVAPHTGTVALDAYFADVGLGNEDTRAVAVGDFDGDGDADVALGDYGRQNRVWFNNGAGQFPAWTGFGGAATNTRALEACDVDDDGDLDLLVANYGQANEVCLNNGSGTFSIAGVIGTGTDNSIALDSGDANGDGNLDVLVGNSNGPCVIYFGNGAGGFAATETVASTALDFTAVAMADLNGDGRLDILLGCGTSGAEYYVRNLGSGQLVLAQTLSGDVQGICLADYDHDGDLDLIPAGNAQIQVNYNDGSFGSTATGNPGATTAVAVGDLNQDGVPEGVGCRNGLVGAALSLGTGPGYIGITFGPSSPAHNSYAIALADLDGDGDFDVIVGNGAGQPSRTYFNRAAAPNLIAVAPDDQQSDLAPSTTYKATFDATVQVGSGQTMPVFSNLRGRLPGTYTLLFGDRDIEFQSAQQLLPGEELSVSITQGLVGTGGTPLARPSVSSFRVRPLLSAADFSAPGTPFASGGSGASVALGDFDSDGDIDAVVANTSGQDDILYLNNGSGVLTAAGVVHVGGDTRGACTGDFDRDGDLDIALAVHNGQSVVLLNAGGGAFTTANLGPAVAPATSLACGDLDCDGDLDIAVGLMGQQNLLYWNDGSAQFPSSLGIGTTNSDTTCVGVTSNSYRGRPAIFFGNYAQYSEAAVWSHYQQQYNVIACGTGTDPTRAIACGDFARDFDTDALLANDIGSPAYYCARTSSFAAPVPLGTAGRSAYAACAGDFDGDGDLDVALGCDGVGQGEVLLNHAGTFATGGALAGTASTRAIACADMDGDGDVDIVAIGLGLSHVLLNGGPAPLLVSSSPALHSSDTPGAASLSATFTLPMAAPTASTCRLFASGELVSGILGGGGTQTLTLDPTRDLRAGEEGVMALAGSTTSSAGSSISRGLVISFRAKPTPGPGLFAPRGRPVSSAVLTRTGTAFGDLDGDGDLDVIVAQGPAGLPVVLSLASGVYSVSGSVGRSGYEYSDVALADLDSDGDLDILLRGRTPVAGGYRWDTDLFVNVASAFVHSGTLVNTNTVGKTGDLNGDGCLDICFVRGSDAIVAFNDGSGDFSNTTTLVAGGGDTILDVWLADVDADYDLDVIPSTTRITFLPIFLNDGAGKFTIGLTGVIAGSGPGVLADLDGDGYLDQACLSAITSRVFDGKTGWTTLPSGNHAVGALDADGDADLDLLVVTPQQEWRLFLNQGGLVFASGPIVAGAVTGLSEPHAADFDGDGDVDVLSCDSLVQLFENTDAPTVVASTPASLAFNPAQGKPGVQFSRPMSPASVSGAMILRGLQSGTHAGTATLAGSVNLEFQPSQDFAAGEWVEAVILPVPQSTSGKVLGAAFAWRFRAAAAAASGTFQPPQPLASTSNGGQCVAGDFDGDGDLDVALTDVGGQDRILLNQGAGTFSATVNVGSAGTGGRYIAAGDLDGDGDLDLMVGDAAGTMLVPFLNNALVFAASTALPASGPFVLSDLDGDGDLDVITADGMYANSGSAAFSASHALVPPGGYTLAGPLAVLDLDGDGRLDVAAATGGGTQRAVLFLNSGAGFAAVAVTADQGAEVLALCAVRWNGDSFDDLLLGTASGGRVLTGSGPTAPTPAGTFGLAGQAITELALGDVDGDGDDDLLCAGSAPFVFHRTTGGFAAVVALPAGCRSCTQADLDGNGIVDALALTNTTAYALLNGGPDADGTLAVSSLGPQLDSVQAARQFVAVGQVSVADGGGPDGLPLSFTSLALDITGNADPMDAEWRLAIPGSPSAVGTVIGSQVHFTGLSITVPSGSSLGMDLLLKLNGRLYGSQDGDQFVVGVTVSSFGGITGSLFQPGSSAQDVCGVLAVTMSLVRFAVSPAGCTAGVAFAVQPQVEAVDAYGNRDRDAGSTIQIDAMTSSPGAAVPVQGIRSQSMQLGLATYSGLSINVIGSGYYLRARTPAGHDFKSEAFDVTGGTAVPQPPTFFRLEVGDPDEAYRAGDVIRLRAHLAQTGLVLTADLTGVDTAMGSGVPLADLGTGWYEVMTPPLAAPTMVEGLARLIPVTATNTWGLSATRHLAVTIDKTGPTLTLSFSQEPGAIGVGTCRISLVGDEPLMPEPLISITGLSMQLDRSAAPFSGATPGRAWTYDLNVPSGLVASGLVAVVSATDRAGNAAQSLPAQAVSLTGTSATVTAFAGSDVVLKQPQRVVVSAVGSQGGSSVQWTQVAGPPVVLSGAAAMQASFFARAAGEYVFRLDVSAGAAGATDYVTVNLPNSLPLVDGGLDRHLHTGSTYLLGPTRYLELPLRGSVFDENGDSMLTEWRLAASPANGNLRVEARNSLTTRVEVVGTSVVPGVYVFCLSAADSPQDAAVDQVRVVVVSPTVVPPAAHAGFDQVVQVGVPVSLSGNESADPDGATPGSLDYYWVIESAPIASSNAQIWGDDQKTPTFVADVAGVYVVSLMVMDAASMNSGQARIRLVANSSGNTVPRGVISRSHTDLDGNGSINVAEPIVLSGVESVDGQSQPIMLRWHQISGPTVDLDDPTAAVQSFVPVLPGNYGFRLDVADVHEWGIPAETHFSVCGAGRVGPAPSAALAVADDSNGDGYVLVIPGTGVDNNPANPEIDVLGAASTVDPALTPSFEWTQVRGPTVAVSGARSANMSFTPLISRVYEFMLRLEDSEGSVHHLRFIMAVDTWDPVVNPGGNAVPRANSGPPASVVAGQLAKLSGTAYDPNNATGLLFYWVQITGAPVVLDTTNPLTPEFLAPLAGTYVFELYVDDGNDISPPVLVTVIAGGSGPHAGGGDDGGGEDGGCSTGRGSDPWALVIVFLLAGLKALRLRKERRLPPV